MSDNESRFTKENREAKELVTLGGSARTISGKLTKSNYFNFLKLDLDSYDDIQLAPAQANKIASHLRKLSTGSTAMTPMYCGGAICPFAARCPLVQMRHSEDEEERGHPQHGKAPVGRQCLIEIQLMKEWIIRYIEEYDVDPNNMTEIGYTNELAEIEILLMRLNMNIAKVENAELVIDQTIAISRYGTPIVQKQLSPFMEMKERLQNRRSKIIKLMVGDRQEQYKKEAALKVKLNKDPSSQHAEMRARLESLTRQLDNMSAAAAESSDEAVRTPQDLIDAAD